MRGSARRGEDYVADASTKPPVLALSHFDIDYWTTGADMVLGVRKVLFSGGVYHSRMLPPNVLAN